MELKNYLIIQQKFYLWSVETKSKKTKNPIIWGGEIWRKEQFTVNR
jgi:hypothetical protein